MLSKKLSIAVIAGFLIGITGFAGRSAGANVWGPDYHPEAFPNALRVWGSGSSDYIRIYKKSAATGGSLRRNARSSFSVNPAFGSANSSRYSYSNRNELVVVDHYILPEMEFVSRHEFPAHEVHWMAVFGDVGDDWIVNDTDIPSEMYGESGAGRPRRWRR